MTDHATPTEIPFAEFVAMRAKAKKSGHRGFSEDELSDLIARTKSGERRAGELLILIHEPFVFKVLRESKRRKSGFANIDIKEAMQEGRIAVLQAAETHDATRGKFTTCLYLRLRASCRRHNSGDPLIWIEPNKFGNGKSYPKADPADVAAVRNVVGWDDVIRDTDESTIGETVSSDDPDPEVLYALFESKTNAREVMRSAMSKLSVRERTVLEMRWSKEDGATLEEVGHVLNVTREGARLIEARAFAKIRRYFAIKKSDSE